MFSWFYTIFLHVFRLNKKLFSCHLKLEDRTLTFIQATILGVVQGVAEFLPISSSGHLTLLQHFFNMQEPDTLYNVLLHFATLIAVVIAYWQDIWEMIVAFFSFFTAKKNISHEKKPAQRLIILLIVATLPLFLVLPIKDKVEQLGNNPLFVAIALLFTGCILFVSDRMANGKKTEKNTTIVDALIIGIAQAFATVPGLSRSGCTISAGMGRGLNRNFAVRFSFLMSLPAVLGATILKVLDVMQLGIDTTLLPKYLVGMVIAGVVGYFSIQLVKLLAKKGKFGIFAFYCWTVGLFVIGYCLFFQA